MRVHLTRLAAAGGTAAFALLTGLSAASLGPAAASVQPAATAHSGWGSAKSIPHLNALAAGGDATASAVNCSSAGNCVAGGFYIDSLSHNQPWLAAQHNGKWGNAFEVPGTASLNAGGDGSVVSISCPSAGQISSRSAGRCTAVGYGDGSSHHGIGWAATRT
jgi:hypothetical protein